LTNIIVTTPDYYNRTHTRAQVTKDIANANTAQSNDANDTIRQIKAMMALNVAAPFGDLLERAAAAVKAKVVVIVGRRDHVVTPGPAIEFARLLHADLLELDGDCGHLYVSCEDERVRQAVASFLAR
jgi:homoserine O-acetyltransferase/O-succinyltransferase